MVQFAKNLLSNLRQPPGLSRPKLLSQSDESSRGQTKTPVVEPPNPREPQELAAFVQSFPFWYHRIYLGNGVFTMDTHGAPAHHEIVWNRFIAAFPRDLQGASVLDVGCNAGYFSLQAKQRGAGRVLGIESVDIFLKQAQVCRQIWNQDIEYRVLDAHQIESLDEQFDVVIFAGLLYHLKNPLNVLEECGRVCRDAILVETEIIPENSRNTIYVRQGPSGQTRVTACHKGMMKFVEADELNGDGSNWWVPDTECVLGMLRTAGFTTFSAPVYLSESRMALIAAKNSQSRFNLQAFK